MCDFGITAAALTAATSLAQGVGGMMAGNANAAGAKAQGEAAWRSAQHQAASFSQRASYEVGGDVARAAASGYGAGTATEALDSKARALGTDIDAILWGGKVAKAEADYSAKLARQRGIGAMIGGVASAAGSVLSVPGIWQTGGGAVNGGYGQMARYGTSRPMVGVGGRLIGGV